MNTSLKLRTIMSCLLLSLGTMAFAQDEEEESSFSLSGSVDAYFRGNLNASNDPEDGGTIAPGSSFANLPGFSLGMANLIAAYEGDKVGFTADLVFGPRGADAVFGSPAALNIVNQLYVYWNMSESITLTVGNFNTFLGYEVISPTANFNYSTSYMFSYGPFSHTGVKLDFDLGGGFSAMGAFMNPTDATDFNPTGTFVGGLQVGYSNDAGGAWVNALFDDEFWQLDLTTGWDVGETVYVGLNATIADETFSGAALYLQNSFSDAFALGIRGEYFSVQTDDLEGAVGVGDGESIFDITLSANYKVGALTFIPEFRLDSFSQDDVVITDMDGSTANSLTSFLVAAVYAF